MRRVMPWVLFAISLSVNAQTEAQFTLVCHHGNDMVGYRDTNIVVDPGNSTVGNARLPATITNGEIRFVLADKELTTTTVINRYTGAMSMSSVSNVDGFRSSTISGTCVRATERKF
jgi:hypothetical protein